MPGANTTCVTGHRAAISSMPEPRDPPPISAFPASGATPQSYRTNGRSGKALYSVPPCAMQSFIAACRLDGGF
jgi:hypothetical protein